MSRYDGPPIPEITRQTTPTEADGIRNALKLVRYGEEGLASKTLPMFRGQLNRKALAEEVGFGRSAYQQNPHIENVVTWIERQLGQTPSTTGTTSRATDRERELASDNDRLKNRNIILKTELDDANAKLQELGYMESTLESGDARLPW